MTTTYKTFNELIDENIIAINAAMRWENYNLNDTILQVTEQIKTDAVNTLKRNYGRVLVESDSLDFILDDIFTFFPSLLQQLSITRLIDSLGVAKQDVDTTTLIRNENLSNEVIQNDSGTATNTATDTTTLNTQQSTLSDNSDSATSSNTQTSITEITNSSGVESTGSRNVNLSHSMPEQSLNSNDNFPVDGEGTPILETTFIQQATEAFSTSNPINSTENSLQEITNTDVTTSSSESENSSTITNTGTNTTAVSNSASDTNESNTLSSGLNTINETVEITSTNKQYAYEIKAFLETADSINAFRIWADNFSWVDGIV